MRRGERRPKSLQPGRFTHGPYASVPITKLTEAFWSHDFDDWDNLAAYKRSLLAQARRAVKALVARGLMEADGWEESQTGEATLSPRATIGPRAIPASLRDWAYRS